MTLPSNAVRLSLVGIIALATLVGCGTLGSKSNQANMTITPSAPVGESIDPSVAHAAGIHMIDAQFAFPLGEFATPGISCGEQPKTLTVGKHIITACTRRGGSYIQTRLWVVAQVGETYTLHFKLDAAAGMKAWITDDHTGQPVGGDVGSVDEPDPKGSWQ